MTFVVASPQLVGSPHRLAAAPPDRHDPVVRDLVEQVGEDAYARGHAEGLREGTATALDRADRLAHVVADAVGRASQQADASRAEHVDDTVRLALTIAETVLRREPHDGGRAVADAVRDAVGQLTDPAPTVHVHPGDRDLVDATLSDLALTVVGDPALQPGDARVRGGWAEVELTTAAAWTAVREALDV